MIPYRLVIAITCAGIALTACASKQTTQNNAPAGSSNASDAAATPLPGKLARITNGMSSDQVIEILGQPDNQNSYVTGKAWIPYYYGSDTSRTDWHYQNLGIVTFSRNQYSGQLKVVGVRGPE